DRFQTYYAPTPRRVRSAECRCSRASTKSTPARCRTSSRRGGVTDTAVARLQMAGFMVLQVTPFTINIAGPREAYESAFQTKIVARELPVIKEQAKADTATFLDSPDTGLLGLIRTDGTPFDDVLEG